MWMNKRLNKPSITREVYESNEVEKEIIRECRFEINAASEVLKSNKMVMRDGAMVMKNGGGDNGEIGKEMRVIGKLVYKFKMQWRREKVIALFKQIVTLHKRFKDLQCDEVLSELLDLIPRSHSKTIFLPSNLLLTSSSSTIASSIQILLKSCRLCLQAALDIRRQISCGLFVHYMLVCLASVSKYFCLCKDLHDVLRKCFQKMLKLKSILHPIPASSTHPSITPPSTHPSITPSSLHPSTTPSSLHPSTTPSLHPSTTTPSPHPSIQFRTSLYEEDLQKEIEIYNEEVISFPITTLIIPITTSPTPHLNTTTPHLNTATPHCNTTTPHLNTTTPHFNTTTPHLNTTIKATCFTKDILIGGGNIQESAEEEIEDLIKDGWKNEEVNEGRVDEGMKCGFMEEVKKCLKVKELEGIVERVADENVSTAKKVCLERLKMMKIVRKRLRVKDKCKENDLIIDEKKGLNKKEMKEIERLKLAGVVCKSFKMKNKMAIKFILKKCKNFVINFINKTVS